MFSNVQSVCSNVLGPRILLIVLRRWTKSCLWNIGHVPQPVLSCSTIYCYGDIHWNDVSITLWYIAILISQLITYWFHIPVIVLLCCTSVTILCIFLYYSWMVCRNNTKCKIVYASLNAESNLIHTRKPKLKVLKKKGSEGRVVFLSLFLISDAATCICTRTCTLISLFSIWCGSCIWEITGTVYMYY